MMPPPFHSTTPDTHGAHDMNTTHMMNILTHQLELCVLAATHPTSSVEFHQWQTRQYEELPRVIRMIDPHTSRQAVLRALMVTIDVLQERAEEIKRERDYLRGLEFTHPLDTEQQGRALMVHDAEITTVLWHRDELDRIMKAFSDVTLSLAGVPA